MWVLGDYFKYQDFMIWGEKMKICNLKLSLWCNTTPRYLGLSNVVVSGELQISLHWVWGRS